jgi:hypothetical protein
VSAWFEDDDAEPQLIREFRQQLPNVLLRRETNSGSSIYNGIFNLLVLAGARDWMTGTIPAYDQLDDHHIVPKSWGDKHLPPNLVHTILNRTPLTAETNRKVIGDRLPNAYLPALIEKNGENAVRATLQTHFISPMAFSILLRDPFGPDDFEAFINERKRTIIEAIERLLFEDRLDLSPTLQALNAEIEAVELGLRQVIDDALGGNVALLPSHVVQKASDRAQAALKKNPMQDGAYLMTLPGKLEFCDLRELQDVILAKAIWPSFESRFVNKDLLTVRFGQLAELRNSLRHSRTVDDITKKEGEAAILWFRHVLAKSVPSPALATS